MPYSKCLNAIIHEVGEFRPISLAEMEDVKLMNRIDVKFMIALDRLAPLLASIRPNYRVLEISKKRNFGYETFYYDTQDLGLYHKHRAGHLNRFKIRHRLYQDSDLAFFEVKFKSNKGRTIKTRIPKKSTATKKLDQESATFLRGMSPIDPEKLESVLCVGYNRITLVSNTERLTLDFELSFRNDHGFKQFPALAIAEVKQEKSGLPSPFLQLMNQEQIRSGAISKYCLGIISLFDHVKRNRFKTQLNSISKINNYYGNLPISRSY
jgi:hypothetical protein